MTSWAERLGAVAVEHQLDSSQEGALRALLECVRDDPQAPTTVTDPAAAVDRHVADSLDALALVEVRRAQRLADVGSGAGFPGLPLAVALPHAEMALVESAGRKCAFLERAVSAAGAANTYVVCRRVEEWSERSLDLVCVRAVAPLAVLVEYAAPLLRVGGALVAWKGRADRDEERAGEEAAEIVGLRLDRVHAVAPRAAAEHRRLHVYVKEEPTPGRFPRRAGAARKRPLAMCNKSATKGG